MFLCKFKHPYFLRSSQLIFFLSTFFFGKKSLFIFFPSCLTDASPASDNAAQEGKIMIFDCIINIIDQYTVCLTEIDDSHS